MTLRVALHACVVSDSERSKAFIYKKYYGYVMAIVIRYMQQEMEAEEVANECFVKVFRRVSSFEKHLEDDVLEKTFRSWLARIAVTTSIDMLRARKKLNYLEEADAQDLAKVSVSSSTSLEARDIMRLLDGLPPIQRAIFNLFEIEGYNHDEIGKALSIPESTSRTYLTRAKKRLRELYAVHHEYFGVKT